MSPPEKKANVNTRIEGGMLMRIIRKTKQAMKRIKISVTLKLPLIDVTFAPAQFLQSNY
jgi:hypothetical protein